jgi:hypothetical protein
VLIDCAGPPRGQSRIKPDNRISLNVAPDHPRVGRIANRRILLAPVVTWVSVLKCP